MEQDGFATSLSSFFKKFWLPLALFVCGLSFLGYGLFVLFGASSKEPEIVFESSELEATSSAQVIMVDVSGAVMHPGVYELRDGLRMRDAIDKAGGLSDEADTEYVARSINLASKVVDGQKIYIPNVDEGLKGIAGIKSDAGSDVAGVQVSTTININTATQASLESLPGIGPVTAQKIISARPYSSIEELTAKKIVGSSVFEKIKALISVY